MRWLIPALAALVLMGTEASAADPPRLPAGVTCEAVRAKVAEHGKIIAYAWATLQGYTRHDLKEAAKCLK
jgi:hypothetical protein